MEPQPLARPTDVKKLRLRYAGTCVACGGTLPQGVQAVYHAPTKTVRCVTCPTESIRIGPAPIECGSAGASAQREHDRRAAKREVRVKDRFGQRLGGVVLALVDEPQSTRAWARGAQGERELANALEGVPDVVVLHDRKVPGTRGNIDHLVIAAGGLFVVDAKRYNGALQIRDKGGLFRTDERLYVGGRDCSHLADNMGWQVSAVDVLLKSVEHQNAVTSVLCFLGVEWPLVFRPKSFRGVHLASPKSLRNLITSTQVLDAAAIEKLARVLATGFPAK